MGRKRKHDPFRDVYLDKGWGWHYRPYLGKGKRGKAVWLAAPDAPPSDVLAAKDRVTNPLADSFEVLSSEYLESKKFKQRKPKTQKGYLACHNHLVKMPMDDGRRFGQLSFRDITPVLMREYMDQFIGPEGELLPGSAFANRNVSYVNTVFRWARQYGKTPRGCENPCAGIDKHRIPHRDYYVPDEDYYHALMLGARYIRLLMELCYLCRARVDEATGFTEANLLDDGLYLERQKGSKTQIIAYTPRLQATLAACRALPGPRNIDPAKNYLLHDARGERLTYECIKSAWARTKKKLVAGGTKPFRLHDLKHKGVSDFEGDKHKATGDWSRNMVKVYDQSVEVIEATR